MDIRELKTAEEIRSAFPLMQRLRTDLNIDSYLSAFKSMADEGYRLFALIDGAKIISLAGLTILTNFYYGRHVWIYDLITDPDKRSMGYGTKMMAYIESWARSEDCAVIALSSGIERSEAHRFYELKAGFEKPSYVFKKLLR